MGLLGWAARIGTDRLFIVQSAITVQQVITVNTEIAAHECLWRLPKTVFTISTNGIRSMQDAECHYSHPMDIVAIFAHKESSLSDPFCSGLRVSRARWCGTASHSSALLDSRIICVSPPARSPSPPWHRSRANWGTMCSGSCPQSQRGITPSENPAQDADRYARVTTRTPGSLGAKRTKTTEATQTQR